MNSKDLLARLRDGEELTLNQQLLLIIKLSVPAIMAQISSIIMQYIDAAMVGRLGANDSASIGLVSSSTWLFYGIVSATSIGFTVQIAQRIGAKDDVRARNLVKQGLLFGLVLSLIVMCIGISVSDVLPIWLGGDESINTNASIYFRIFAMYIPLLQINSLASGMIQCSGNMRFPSIMHIIMCFLDVCFNMIFIFGFGLGVKGAALGTACAELVCMTVVLVYLLFGSPMLKIRKNEKFHFYKADMITALKVGIPVGFEQMVMTSAQIMTTKIIAPLGNIAIAANSFSVTAEGLCYMPGYGIGTAATTIIGQSIGASRVKESKKIGWLITILGMIVMTFSAILMYIFAPNMIGILSPDPEIRELGAHILRIEAFAEPMYAASIVASGVFRGAGDTFVPSCISLFTMWCVRIVLALILTPIYGLSGAWIAMCIELCVRGVLFLIRLGGKGWQKKII